MKELVFLIVDDSKLQRKSLNGIISKCGFKVIAEASNGIEAIEKYKEYKPDVVTLDITMPEMDGMEALEKILNFDGKAKIIMVSSEGDSINIDKAFNIGALGFIIKPLNEEKIKKALAEIIF